MATLPAVLHLTINNEGEQRDCRAFWGIGKHMLEYLDHYDGSKAEQARICAAFEAARQQLREPGPREDRSLVARAEGVLRSDPNSALSFNSEGFATLKLADGEFAAGRFSCRSLASLTRQTASFNSYKLRLFVLAGTSPETDIGALQALAPPRSLFQVASQFNCLESPGPYLASVTKYFSDPTQGPRASISAFPGTLLRHYAAPDGKGGRFVQKDPSPQINLLRKLSSPEVAQVQSGYLLASHIKDPKAFGEFLQQSFLDIEVGLQEAAEVVLGANWDGRVEGRPLIAQAFTSTLAAGGYGHISFQASEWLLICRQLLRAAYLGTLSGALVTGQKRAVLTLIGGGVFGNPISLIWDGIVWACRQVQSQLKEDFTVILNGRDIGSALELSQIQKTAREFGGDLILCHPSGTRFGL